MVASSCLQSIAYARQTCAARGWTLRLVKEAAWFHACLSVSGELEFLSQFSFPSLSPQALSRHLVGTGHLNVQDAQLPGSWVLSS